MYNRCTECGEQLNDQEIVYAGLGHIFCCQECAKRYFIDTMTVEQLAEYTVSACVETIRAADIGIDSEDDDVCECNWCENEFERSELTRTDLGLLCDRCIAAIRSRGEEVIVYE